jgi:hypothetical protein
MFKDAETKGPLTADQLAAFRKDATQTRDAAKSLGIAADYGRLIARISDQVVSNANPELF